MTDPFFCAEDNLGTHAYFKSPADAQAHQANVGGYVLMTTHGMIWRVTTPTPTTTPKVSQ